MSFSTALILILYLIYVNLDELQTENDETMEDSTSTQEQNVPWSSSKPEQTGSGFTFQPEQTDSGITFKREPAPSESPEQNKKSGKIFKQEQSVERIERPGFVKKELIVSLEEEDEVEGNNSNFYFNGTTTPP